MPAKKTTTTKSAPKKTAAKKAPAKSVVKKTTKAVAKTPEVKKVEKSMPVKAAAKKTSAVTLPTGEYYYANGKRKTAVARVRLYKNGSGIITVNGRVFEEYFTVLQDQDKIHSPLRMTNNLSTFDITVMVAGSGLQSQAEAIRHGISKALVDFKPEFRTMLKQEMFLRRDSRIKERKKFGLKRARRAPQWSKR